MLVRQGSHASQGRYRLGVRTGGSQPSNRGSNPRTGTKNPKTQIPKSKSQNPSPKHELGRCCSRRRGRVTVDRFRLLSCANWRPHESSLQRPLRNCQRLERTPSASKGCHVSRTVSLLGSRNERRALGTGRIITQGKHLGTVPTARQIQNLAFAGPDKKTLYLVGRAAWKIETLTQGCMRRASREHADRSQVRSHRFSARRRARCSFAAGSMCFIAPIDGGGNSFTKPLTWTNTEEIPLRPTAARRDGRPMRPRVSQ